MGRLCDVILEKHEQNNARYLNTGLLAKMINMVCANRNAFPLWKIGRREQETIKILSKKTTKKTVKL